MRLHPRRCFHLLVRELRLLHEDEHEHDRYAGDRLGVARLNVRMAAGPCRPKSVESAQAFCGRESKITAIGAVARYASWFAVAGCSIHQPSQQQLDAAVAQAEAANVSPTPSPSIDPRFVRSVDALVVAVRALPPIPEDVDEPALYAALQRLADTLDLVPAEFQVHVALGDAASLLRTRVSVMPLGFEERSARLATAKRALATAAVALSEVSSRSYAHAPDVGRSASELVAATVEIDPAAPPRRHREAIALALRRAVDVLTAMERAIRSGRAQPG
jgi:hypothetical protein